MEKDRPSGTRKPSTKAVANKASPCRRRANAPAKDVPSPCQMQETKTSPADNGAGSLITPLTSPRDDNNLDKQLDRKCNRSDTGVEFGEGSEARPPTLSPISSAEPERVKFFRTICPCCNLGPESFTGEPGDKTFQRRLKDKVLVLLFRYRCDAENFGDIFAEAAESCYPRRVWLKTELKEALADSRIYNLGLELLERRIPGLIEGCSHLVHRAKREVEEEEREKEEEKEKKKQKQKEEDHSDAALHLLYSKLEKEYRLEKGKEEMTSASVTPLMPSIEDDASNVPMHSQSVALMDVEVDDDATLDGDETDVDERYASVLPG